jgi:hypothetical protein
MRKEKVMDRSRFEHLLDAYGANFERWPARDRAAGEAYTRTHGADVASAVATARLLDTALDAARAAPRPGAALAARILSAAPTAKPASAMRLAPAGWALAACALLGAILGYGAGALASPSDDGSYFAAAFEAPPVAPPAGDEE